MKLTRVLALAGASLVLAGCGSSASTGAGPTASASAKPPAAPTVGACRLLAFKDASAQTNDLPPVPCSAPHTAITVDVGSLVDAKHPTLTNVNAPEVQHRLAVSCPTAAQKYLGASENTLRLSQVVPIWFLPTPAQIEAGAHWYRCDVVVLARPNELGDLPATMSGALAQPQALNDWGTCANVAPASQDFRRQLCRDPHHWRAVSVVEVPAATKYLDKAAGADASKQCGEVAKSLADNPQKFSWSFEWPNQQQWQAGQRFGLCWLPESD